jgi:two-component system LytT family response regulator
MLRVLGVDDEPLARERLIRALEREADLQVVGEAGGGREALEAVRAQRPDLLFLDIEMPGVGGFHVVRALGREGAGPPPAVVFVTAHDSFAVQAFEVRAIDYVVKPFKPARIAEAVQRARAQVGREREMVRLLEKLLSQAGARAPDDPPPAPLPAGPGPLARIWVKKGDKHLFVKTGDVDWFESHGNYVRLHVGTASYLVRTRISDLEAVLPPEQFARIHRSTIVNVDRVAEIAAWFGGDYIVTLRDGTQLKLTRFYRGGLLRDIPRPPGARRSA